MANSQAYPMCTQNFSKSRSSRFGEVWLKIPIGLFYILDSSPLKDLKKNPRQHISIFYGWLARYKMIYYMELLEINQIFV